MTNWYPIGKNKNITYISKQTCELVEGVECFDITGLEDPHIYINDNGVLKQDASLKAQNDLKKQEALSKVNEKEQALNRLKAKAISNQDIKDLLLILEKG